MTISQSFRMGFDIRYRVIGPENVYYGDVLPLMTNEKAELPFLLTASYGYDVTKRTLLIYGHVDVKPVSADECWSNDPFAMQVIG